MKFRFLTFLLLSGLFACTTIRPPHYNAAAGGWENRQVPADEPLAYRIFLMGDAGKPQFNPLEPSFKLLGNMLQQATDSSAVVFLGDNLYPQGLADTTARERREQEKYLLAQLNLLEGYPGRPVFIPGNHDWAQGRRTGYRNVLNQQQFIDAFLQQDDVFLPRDGCPGPVEVPLTKKITLIAIDTQWWLHRRDKPGEDSECEAKTDDEFLIQVNDLVQKNAGKQVIVVGHHPMFSNGLHGGYAPAKTNLFALTDLNPRLYIPLPVLGSVYYFYRTAIGDIQDIPHPRYQQLKRGLANIFQQHPNLVYACGHDHSLQYFEQQNVHYVVSGAGCKETWVSRNDRAEFAWGNKGFATLDFYRNGEAWVQFHVPVEDGSTGEVVYRRKLFRYEPPLPVEEEIAFTDFASQRVAAPATTTLGAGKLKKLVLGENYREEWQQVIDNVPVFDLGTEKGGLEIIKRGGGMQTRSLRLQAEDGKQYVLRSIEKYPEKAVPVALRGTIGEDIVRDQISGSHPYGAFVVPFLADKAGVYHTNPRLVYLPDDPRLGEYREDFANGLYLYEERPDEDWRQAGFFGNSKNIVGTPKVLEKIMDDNDNLIDQRQVLRTRLFDLWIGDWDRHDDQWRWAEQKDKKKEVEYYQPIPRDRDQAFFDAGGLLMALGTRKWGLRKFQGFKDRIRDPVGLGFNARYFDRTFLTGMDYEDWMAMTDTLQQALTDEAIEQAIRQFPPEIFQHHGEEIIRKLKSRRDELKETATTFYLALSRAVDVVGTNKHELFKVERLNNSKTRVRVWKIKKDSDKKKHKIFDRTFNYNETREIRLYGLGGEDIFEVSGEVNRGIKVRAIGGAGFDVFEDESRVAGPGKKTVVYDNLLGNELRLGGEARDRTSTREDVNSYDRKAFQYDLLAPVLFFAFNPDDGLFLGGGARLVRHGFRKEPYKSQQQIKANFAPRTNSYNFTWQGEFIHVLGRYDLLLNGDLKQPSFVDFFYGLGNETTNRLNGVSQNYYRFRYSQTLLDAALRRQSNNGKSQFTAGLGVQFIEVEEPDEEDSERFVFDYYSGEDSLQLFDDDKLFGSLQLGYQLDLRDNTTMPTQGILLSLGASRVSGLRGEDQEEINFTRFTGEFAFWLSAGGRFRTTLASRVGGAINDGNFQESFQANRLGGGLNLRGYRRMRFAGERAFYWNNDLRIKLFNIRSYLFPGEFGINGFVDSGRVWVDNDPSTETGTSDQWHTGYGGGIWITPYQFTVIGLDLAWSEEEQALPFLRFGFFF